MACPICNVCASCKGTCSCGLKSSQARVLSMIFAKSNVSKTNKETNRYMIQHALAKKTYEEIKEGLKAMGVVFRDDIAYRAVENKEKEIQHPVYDGGCFQTAEQGRELLGKTTTACEFKSMGARDRCIYCNSLKFYQTGKICLSISQNLCPENAATIQPTQ